MGRSLFFTLHRGRTTQSRSCEASVNLNGTGGDETHMDDLPLRLKTFLLNAADRLRELRLPHALCEAIERLSGQADQPCVVAVVGRMKAGKSTFINALLGEDLAKVGATETTATINYFRFGTPNPTRSIRCHWQNGSITEEERAFVDSLQGNDPETLRRASGIKCLEYHLLNPYLERVTLVDTPGLSAVVDEHVQRTAEFLALQRQLRDRHNKETERLGSEADAVIYLTGQIARTGDQAFLDEFRSVTGGRSKALNAVGVLAKIDLHPGIIQRRDQLADQISAQLRDSLNTVVPISAGVQRAADRLRDLGPMGLPQFLATLQRIPPTRLEKLLDSEEFYRELETEDCPVTIAEREALLGDMPWAVFTTLVREAASSAFDPIATEAAWRSLAGFDRLRELLDRHFIRRAQFLRCYRIVKDVHSLLNEVRFKHLPEQRRHDREQKARLDRFLQFVRGVDGNQTVARELEDFLVEQSGLHTGGSERMETAWKDLDRCRADFSHELEELNADFEVLQKLEDNLGLFSARELDELRSLFGLYGLDPIKRIGGRLDSSELAVRQQCWMRVAQEDGRSERRVIAENAVLTYGLIHARLRE